MKKIILSVVLLLSTSFVFANSSKEIDLNNKENRETIILIDKNEIVFNNLFETFVTGDRWGIGCYVDIYYEGEYVGTVFSYESGETYAEAYDNCRSSAMGKATEFMMAE